MGMAYSGRLLHIPRMIFLAYGTTEHLRPSPLARMPRSLSSPCFLPCPLRCRLCLLRRGRVVIAVLCLLSAATGAGSTRGESVAVVDALGQRTRYPGEVVLLGWV